MDFLKVLKDGISCIVVARGYIESWSITPTMKLVLRLALLTAVSGVVARRQRRTNWLTAADFPMPRRMASQPLE